MGDTPWPPMPQAARDFALERGRMVLEQMEAPRDGRPPIRDPRVLAAMAAVPRHIFVPRMLWAEAHEDHPLPIEHGQTISQPYIVAVMAELAAPSEHENVLEVGTGSGYAAAVLGHLCRHVCTVEVVDALARRAAAVLSEHGYRHIAVRIGDGADGWPERAPFDAIVVAAACPRVPETLWSQLAPGGRLVLPLERPNGFQRLEVLSKAPAGERSTHFVMDVRFVPMTGKSA